MSITFILLCVGAYLLFFLLRRWEAKEKPYKRRADVDSGDENGNKMAPVQYPKK